MVHASSKSIRQFAGWGIGGIKDKLVPKFKNQKTPNY
jgi:hypothetical protein